MVLVIHSQGVTVRVLALVLIAIFHLVLVYLANKHFSLRGKTDFTDMSLIYISLPVSLNPKPEIIPPDFSASHSSISPEPPVSVPLQIDADTVYENEPSTYVLPSAKAEKYQHLFDPRLREQLQNLKHFTKSKTRSVDGIQILDLGDGMCEVTSVNKSGGPPPSESKVVKCGNNQSEQMIENMEKALADPLGLK